MVVLFRHRRWGVLWVALILSALILAAPASAKVQISFETPNSSAERKIRSRLVDSPSVNSTVAFLNDVLALKYDVTLAFGSYKRIWYENHRIEIPYLFIEDIRRRYKNARIPHNNKSDIDVFTGNALIHIILHEMGHAVIGQYQIPVLGKVEDAADGFADVLLLQYFDNGADIIHSAADLFYINSRTIMRLRKEDYWSEHSLDRQRYYARLCHIYGSNPDKHQAIRKQARFDNERAERCIIQYDVLASGWLALLKPVLKQAEPAL